MSLALWACGGSTSHVPPASSGGSLSGNWQITLKSAQTPQPLIYSGFLLQSGKTVTGSVILGGSCSGVGPVTGTLDAQNLQLTVDEFGQDLSLTGTLSSGSGSSLVGGPFSTLNGGCTLATSGTWSGLQVPTLNGAFHGALVSAESNGTVQVAGTLTQSPNIGASNASLSGVISTTGVPPFCAYLNPASITGTISGTSVTMFFYAPNGSLLNASGSAAHFTLAPDGTSLTGDYAFQAISQSCTGDIGKVQLNFP